MGPRRVNAPSKETVAAKEELIKQIIDALGDTVPTGTFPNFHATALAHEVNRMRKALDQQTLEVAEIRKVLEEEVLSPQHEPSVHDGNDKQKSHFDSVIYYAGLPPAYWWRLPEMVAREHEAGRLRTTSMTKSASGSIISDNTTTANSTRRATQRQTTAETTAPNTRKKGLNSKLASAAVVPATSAESGEHATTKAEVPKILKVMSAKAFHRRRRLWRYRHQALFITQWRILSQFDDDRFSELYRSTTGGGQPSKLKRDALASKAAESRLELAMSCCEWKRKHEQHYKEDFVKLLDYLRSVGIPGDRKISEVEDDAVSAAADDVARSIIPREILPEFLDYLRCSAKEQLDVGHAEFSASLTSTVDMIERLSKVNLDGELPDDGSRGKLSFLLDKLGSRRNTLNSSATNEEFTAARAKKQQNSTRKSNPSISSANKTEGGDSVDDNTYADDEAFTPTPDNVNRTEEISTTAGRSSKKRTATESTVTEAGAGRGIALAVPQQPPMKTRRALSARATKK